MLIYQPAHFLPSIANVQARIAVAVAGGILYFAPQFQIGYEGFGRHIGQHHIHLPSKAFESHIKLLAQCFVFQKKYVVIYVVAFHATKHRGHSRVGRFQFGQFVAQGHVGSVYILATEHIQRFG